MNTRLEFGVQAARDISASLVGNMHLERLMIYCRNQRSFDCYGSEELLCVASSIESIANSNHTLQTVSIEQSPSTVAQQCLILNKNKNKAKVICDKILRFTSLKSLMIGTLLLPMRT
jgi:hypothetical protein